MQCPSDSHSAAALYRLPRHYLDQYHDTSAPIIGSSGSTLLHFSAANGHTNIVHALLSYGGHADMADKHGVGAGYIE